MKSERPTSPLVKVIDGQEKKLTRRFLGNLFPKNTKEKNELKSYLKGNTEYSFVTKTYRVRQVYYYN